MQRDIVWAAVRGVVLAATAGLGGYAPTMLLRSTVATIALLALSAIERSALWSPATNVFAWIRDGVRVFDGTVVRGPAQELCDNQCTASLARGATYPGVLLPVSALVFQRRDVP